MQMKKEDLQVGSLYTSRSSSSLADPGLLSSGVVLFARRASSGLEPALLRSCAVAETSSHHTNIRQASWNVMDKDSASPGEHHWLRSGLHQRAVSVTMVVSGTQYMQYSVCVAMTSSLSTIKSKSDTARTF